jgi:hypothetical protein
MPELGDKNILKARKMVAMAMSKQYIAYGNKLSFQYGIYSFSAVTEGF